MLLTARLQNQHSVCWWLGKAPITVLGCPDLVVGSPKPTSDILVIQNLYLKAEVLLQILDDHDQEWQLDAQGFSGVSWTGDIGRANVAAHNLQDARLDVAVGDALDVTISHCTQLTAPFSPHAFTKLTLVSDMSKALPCLSQICRGLLPMLYKMERKPDWKVFLNIVVPLPTRDRLAHRRALTR